MTKNNTINDSHGKEKEWGILFPPASISPASKASLDVLPATINGSINDFYKRVYYNNYLIY